MSSSRATCLSALLIAIATAGSTGVCFGDETGDAKSSSDRRGPMLVRLAEQLNQLDLTPEQKQKVDTILDTAAERFNALRRGESSGNLRDAATKIGSETREELAKVLSPQQVKRMGESFSPAGPTDEKVKSTPQHPPKSPTSPANTTAGRGSETKPVVRSKQKEGSADRSAEGTSAKSPAEAPAREEKKPARKTESVAKTPPTDMASSTDAKKEDKPSARPEKASREPSAERPPRPSPPPMATLLAGTAAPAFSLMHAEGQHRKVSLADYAGRPTVIVFGSWSSPTFRDKIPLVNNLRKAYRGKVNFVVVYTREAYPANEWEVQRNLDEQINVRLATTIEERIKMAKLTDEGFGLQMDMLVDDMDDAVAKAYDAVPNAAVVIDDAGRIVGRWKWAEPYAIKAAVDSQLKDK